MKEYREDYKGIHIAFIDLEKNYNRVPRDVMLWVLENKRVPLK